MEQKYRLKKEVYNYFPPSYYSETLTIEKWTSKMVPETMLDKVERVYVQYGHGDDSFKSLGGYSRERRESEIRFTVILSDSDHDEFSDMCIDQVMGKIQAVLNNHFIK